MNWFDNLLIIGGISFDIFASMESQGSVVAKITKKELGLCSLLACFWQAAAFGIGYFLSGILIQKDQIAENEKIIGTGIAVIIFAGLGIHFIVKAIPRELVYEHREVCLNQKKILQGLAGTGAYTLLAGIGSQFVSSVSVTASIAMIAVFSVAAVVCGVYTGYRFGAEQRRRAYVVGAVLLWLAGADLLLKMVFK